MAAAPDVATLATAPAEEVHDDDAPLWERSFAFGRLPRLVIQEHFGAGLGGTVWAGGVKLARYLVDDGGAGRLVSDLRAGGVSPERRLTALELGAGCSGIPGLVLAQLGLFGTICITDGDDDAVERLVENLADNTAALTQQTFGGNDTLVTARMLRWGHDTDLAAAAEAVDGGLYDVVVAADIAYKMRATDPGAAAVVAALCGTIRRLMRHAGVCVLSQMVRQTTHILCVCRHFSSPLSRLRPHLLTHTGPPAARGVCAVCRPAGRVPHQPPG
jgi:hypothetical protein